MADEKELLMKAFKDVDRKGDGCFARGDLAKVFKELEEWTEEDLSEMFDSFDTRKDGQINYTELIEWLLGDDGDDEHDREDSDADDAEEMAEVDAAAEEIGLDLDERMSREQWLKIMRGMSMCEDEAEHIYQAVVQDMAKQNQSAADGIPLIEFMDDLQIDSEDLDALRLVKKAVDKMKSGEMDNAAKSTFSMDIAIDKIVRLLDIQKRPADDAWEVAMQGDLSAAGFRLVQDTYSNNKAGLIEAVRKADVSPPLLPSTAGQRSNKEHCQAAVRKIVEECKAKGGQFTDPEWNCLERPNEVLYVDKEKPGYDCTVAKPHSYKRLSDLVDGEQLFKGGVGAGDIRQGQIGTCFLLGAMGAVAGNSARAIQNLFVDYDVQVGVYGVRFCVHGEWVNVLVDDYVPVDANNRVLFAHSKDGDELWVTLIEKAFCKLYTCYEMCDGGRPMEAIFSLYGGVSGKFEITQKHKESPGQYFSLLKNSRQQGWLLTTSFVISANAKKGGGKCGEAVLPTGLVGGHVYSVLKMVEACGVKLVKCRNPWGTGEWMGKYGDKNAYGEWTEELKKATGYLGENDGSFWMAIEDFVANSSGVEYARTFSPEWKKVTQHRIFQEGALQAQANWAYNGRSKDELTMPKGATLEVLKFSPGWWYGNVAGAPATKGFFPGNYVKLVDRPVARFDLQGAPSEGSKAVRVVISLMQPNAKMMRKWKPHKSGLNYKDTSYPGLQFVVIGPDGKVALKRSGKKRCLSGEVTLPGGGLWKIYPLSDAGTGAHFSLRAYVKGGTVSMKEIEGARLSEIMDHITA